MTATLALGSAPAGLELDDAKTAVDAERIRIARELHDVVAHGLAAIALHAGTAARVAETRPAQAHAALDAIRASSREVLDELRVVLGQLRDVDEAPRAHGIATLDALAERTTAGHGWGLVDAAGATAPPPPAPPALPPTE